MNLIKISGLSHTSDKCKKNENGIEIEIEMQYLYLDVFLEVSKYFLERNHKVSVTFSN